ncbi:MAG: VCBS repeat-containing protein [Candidatus Tectomicrobia bacterium]|uniref:VCBS repeat-containing protein n=1 Tax=Tectimicrobiota bacterium TaxID=2528274 RepID=A0A938B2W5_UNCTE|nr:VCBS repeat-containing protein [Candidatus Tectomicrobia bacterium]
MTTRSCCIARLLLCLATLLLYHGCSGSGGETPAPPPGGGTPPPVVSAVSLNTCAGASVVADGVNAVSVQATLQTSNALPAGIPVTFTTTQGHFLGGGATTTGMTTAEGIATATLIAPTSPTTATITASANGLSAQTVLPYVAETLRNPLNPGRLSTSLYPGQLFATDIVPGQPFGAEKVPIILAVADVNGDGQLDLLAVSRNATDVAVFLGQSSGVFSNVRRVPVRIAPAAALPIAFAVADVSGGPRGSAAPHKQPRG